MPMKKILTLPTSWIEELEFDSRLPWQTEKQSIHSEFSWAQHESWGALIDSYL